MGVYIESVRKSYKKFKNRQIYYTIYIQMKHKKYFIIWEMAYRTHTHRNVSKMLHGLGWKLHSSTWEYCSSFQIHNFFFCVLQYTTLCYYFINFLKRKSFLFIWQLNTFISYFSYNSAIYCSFTMHCQKVTLISTLQSAVTFYGVFFSTSPYSVCFF